MPYMPMTLATEVCSASYLKQLVLFHPWQGHVVHAKLYPFTLFTKIKGSHCPNLFFSYVPFTLNFPSKTLRKTPDFSTADQNSNGDTLLTKNSKKRTRLL